MLEPRRLLTGAPTLSPLSEQVVNEDFEDWTIEFTVDDVDTALNDLELTATSSQPNVIANDGLTITGSGSERTLHLRSLPDAWGDTTISVSANDGNASTIQSFQVSVNPTNDPPRFSGLSDTTVTEGSSTRVAFEVTDVETAAEQLTVTATTSHPGSVAPQDIVLTQEGQAWTADLTSQPGQFGEVIVSFTAHDGTATSTQSIVANVLPDPTSNHAPHAVSDQFNVAPATTFAESSSAILSNDVDVDGDQLLVELVSDVNHGHLELSTTGDFTYTPNAEFQGDDFFTYRVFDGNLYSAPTTVHLKVASNAPPVTVTDLYATDEDTALWVSPEQGVLANDSDPDSPFLKAVLVSDVEHGTLHFAQDGSFTYEPHPHFAGQDHFAYSVQDDQHVSQTVTATIDVHPVNDAAIAKRDNYVATEGTTLSVLGNQSVLSNDSDVDGDALTAIQFDLPQHGQLNFADDGTFTYTPEPGFVGVDHFLYTTSDGTATSNLARVTIEVQPGDDAPVATADQYFVSEDQSLTVDGADGVLINDYDRQQQSLSASLAQSTQHGTLTLQADGGFSYLPNPGFSGTDSFTYRASDGGHDSPLVVASITVLSEDDIPAASPEQYVATENQTLSITSTDGVLANDSDQDGDVLRALIVSSTSNGDLNLSDDGAFTYTPQPGFHGTDAFTYVASDGANRSQHITVTLAVESVNDAPVAASDHYGAWKNRTLQVEPSQGLISNDHDPEEDSLSVTLATNVTHGQVLLHDDGSFEYIPNPDYVGTDAFAYQLTDGIHTSPPIPVEIAVQPLNDTLDNATLISTTPATISAVLGDEQHGNRDVDLYSISATSGQLLVVDVDSLNPGPTGIATGGVDTRIRLFDVHGRELASSSAHASIDPRLEFRVGEDATFYIGISAKANADYDPLWDASGLASETGAYTVSIALNNAPEASAESFLAFEDTTLSIAASSGLLQNATDIDGDDLQAQLVSTTTHGRLQVQADGSFTYVPQANFAGIDHFSYRASDGTLVSQVVDVEITVVGTDDPPNTIHDTYEVHAGATLTVDASAGLLANDVDVDGDALHVAEVTQPTQGVLQVQSDGSFTFAAPSSEGLVTFSYEVSDGTSPGGVAEVKILVTNAVPTPREDTYTTSMNTPLEVTGSAGVLQNDTDADADPLTALLFQSPQHGTVNLQEDGSFLYTPNADFVGTDTFAYLAADPFGDSDMTTVTLHVTDQPVLVHDNDYEAIHSRTLSVAADQGVLTHSWNVDGGILVAELESPPVHGTLSLHEDGSFEYTPDPGFTGQDSFTYRGSNGTYDDSGTIAFAIVNTAPTAKPDDYQLAHDRSLEIPATNGVLANDSDGEQDVLSVTLVSAPSSGVVTLNADGSFIYTPDAGFVGEDIFTYHISDGIATTEETVTLHVVNHAPAPLADHYRMVHDRTLEVTTAGGVRLNDGDSDSDPLVVTLASGPDHGQLTLANDGSFTYLPPAKFVGEATFTYRVSDGIDTSDPVPVTISVENSAPTSHPKAFFVQHGHTLTVAAAAGLLEGNTDSETDPLTAVQSSNPEHGTVTVSADGALTYTPDPGFTGFDSFEYHVDDGVAASAVAIVLIEVTDTVPQFLSDTYDVLHDQILTVETDEGVLQNDVDAESDPLTAKLVTAPAHGNVAFQSDGAFVYTPDADFVGKDSFTYRVDYITGESDEIPVDIDVTNSIPIVSSDRYHVLHDTALAVDASDGVAANDHDSDVQDELVTQVATAPAHGELVLNSDGSFTYTPEPAYVGPDHFSYTVSDGAFTSGPIHVELAVTNATPRNEPKVYEVSRNDTLVVPVSAGVLSSAHDDDDDPLTLVIVDEPENGSLQMQADGSFTYLPNTDYEGSDRFSYRVSDGVSQGGLTFAYIHVASDAPIAVNDRYSIAEDSTLNATVSVLANDVNRENETLRASIVQATVNGQLVLNPDGTFQYTPEENFAGDDYFVYEVTDGISTSLATVQIHVTSVNDAPVAAAISVSGHANRDLQGNLLADANDADGDPLTVQLISPPSHGTVSLAAGDFTYTPNSGYVGTDSFDYRLADGQTTSNTATVTLTLTNAPPLVADVLQYNVASSNTLQVDASNGVAAAATDAEGDTITATLVSGPTHGTVSLETDGSFTYTADSGFEGTDAFHYTLSDGTNASATKTVQLHVSPAQIVVNPNFYRVLHDTMLSVGTKNGLLYNDWHTHGEAITAVLNTGPTFGGITLMPNGTFLYVPNPGFVGTDTFTYYATDGDIDSRVTQATIHVTNQAPVANSDNYSVHHGQTLTVSGAMGVATDDFDHDGEAFTVSLVSGPQHGTLTLGADGAFVYSPGTTAHGDNFVGTDFFTYRLFDGAATSQTASVTIQVQNTLPVGNPNTYSVHHRGTLEVNASDGVMPDDYDFDTDALTAHLVDTTDHGTLEFQSDGSFNYTPHNADPRFVGTDRFTYRLYDGAQYSAPISVAIKVWNHIPEPTANYYTVPHGETLSGHNVLDNDVEWDDDADQDHLSVELVNAPWQGTLTLNPDGTFVYQPGQDQQGNDFAGTVRFSYRVFDGAQHSEPVTVTIDVQNIDPVPVDDFYEIHHTTSELKQNVLKNDWDHDEDDIQAVLVSGPRHAQSDFSLNEAGEFRYRPEPGFAGEDRFTYRLNDGTGAHGPLATVTIHVQNSPPFAVDDFYLTNAGVTLQVDATQGFLSNDLSFDEDALTVTIHEYPKHGTLVPSELDPGAFTYTPKGTGTACSPNAKPMFVGSDSFTYKITDKVNFDIGTVQINVAKNLVVAIDDHFPGQPGGTVSGNVMHANGHEADIAQRPRIDQATLKVTTPEPLPQSYLRVKLLDPPSKGELVGNWRDDQGLNENGDFEYRANHGAKGIDHFTYELTDCTGNSSKGTVLIHFDNTIPRVQDNTGQVAEDGVLTVTPESLLENASDNENNIVPESLRIVRGPRKGELTRNEDGTWAYQPQGDFHGQDSFTFAVSDRVGAESVEGLYVISVTPENDPIEAQPDIAGLYEGANSVEIDVLKNDTDIDGPIDPAAVTLQVVSQPSHGTVSIANGKLTYAPHDPDYFGQDTFTYQADDGDLSNEATVVVDVFAINDAPVAGNDAFSTDEDQSVTFHVLSNDTDIDNAYQPQATSGAAADDTHHLRLVEVVRLPEHGRLVDLVNQSGIFTYHPAENFHGADSFTYIVYDADWEPSEPATVHLTVNPVNDVPVARVDHYISEEESVTVDVLGNDYDVDGDAITIIEVSDGSFHGGSISYTRPNALERGKSISYTISDGNGGTATAFLTIDFDRIHFPGPSCDTSYPDLFDDDSGDASGTGNDSVTGGDSGTDGSNMSDDSGESGSEMGGDFDTGDSSGMDEGFGTGGSHMDGGTHGGNDSDMSGNAGTAGSDGGSNTGGDSDSANGDSDTANSGCGVENPVIIENFGTAIHPEYNVAVDVSGKKVMVTFSPGRASVVGLEGDTFGAHVYAANNIGVAHGSWGGSADNSLSFSATGDVEGSIDILGDLYVRAGYDVHGHMKGGNIQVRAGTNVGAVTALGTVYAVEAGHDIGGNIDAVGDILHVSAGQSISSEITSEGNIHHVEAGQNFSGYLEALGNVGIISDDPKEAPFGGVFVGGHLTADIIAVGGSIVWVNADASINQVQIQAANDIYQVRADENINTTTILAQAGDIGGVSAGIHISGANKIQAPQASVGPMCHQYWTDWWDPLWHWGVVANTGNIEATITAQEQVYQVRAGHSILPGTSIRAAQDDIGAVHAIYHIHAPIAAGDDIDVVQALYGNIRGSIEAAGDIRSIAAGRDLAAPVDVGAGLGTVRAGRDITASITANGETESPGTGCGQEYTSDLCNCDNGQGADIGEFKAGRDATGAELTSARDIGPVTVGRNLTGKVDARRDLDVVTVGFDATNDILAGRNIQQVSVGHYLSGDVKAATGSIQHIVAGGNAWWTPVTSAGKIDGSVIKAKLDIPAGVHALAAPGHQGDIRGATITSSTGALGRTIAAAGIDAQITAEKNIAEISAGWVNGGDVTSSVQSKTGSIASVSALRSPYDQSFGTINATIDAQVDVTNVYASTDILQAIHAGQTIGGVFAGRDLKGDLEANEKSVGEQTGHSGPYAETEWLPIYPRGRHQQLIEHPFLAEAGISAGRDLLANITAGTNIGSIYAGRDLGDGGQSIRSGEFQADGKQYGDIGWITVGDNGGGNVSLKLIQARGNLGAVTVYGEIDRNIAGPDNIPTPAGRPTDPGGDETPELRRLQHILEGDTVSKGDLNADIKVARQLARVVAYGHIEGKILTAQSGHPDDHPHNGRVWALGDINAGSDNKISAGVGSVDVTAWGRIDGEISSLDGAVVRAYDDLDARIVTWGQTHISSWASIGAAARTKLAAVADVNAWAHQHIAANVFSSTSNILKTAWQSVSTDSYALNVVKDYTLDIRKSHWVTIQQPVVALAMRDIVDTKLAGPYIFAQAGRDIHELETRSWDLDLIAGNSLSDSALYTYRDLLQYFIDLAFEPAGIYGNALATTLLTGTTWAAESIGNTLLEIPNAAADIGDDIADLIHQTKEGIPKTIDKLTAITQSITDAIKTAVENPEETLDQAKAKLEKVLESVAEIPGRIMDFIGNVASAIGSLCENLGEMIDKLDMAMEGLVDKLVGWANVKVLEGVASTSMQIGSGLGLTARELTGGEINAKSGNLTVWGPSDTPITVTRDVELYAYGDVSQSITSSDGTVQVRTKNDVSATLEGHWSAAVEAWGQVNASVTSEKGPVAVDGYEGVSGTVTAGREAHVTSWKDVSGTVTANGGFASVFAAENVDATITAAGDVSVEAWGNVTSGEITSGTASEEAGSHDVEITAHGSIDTTVDAHGSIYVAAHQNVSGELTAQTGLIQVESVASIDLNQATAGGNISADALVDVKGKYTSQAPTGHVQIHAHENADVTVEAGTYVSVQADQNATANIRLNSPAGSISVLGLADNGTTVDLTVPQADGAEIDVLAGGDAKLNVTDANIDSVGVYAAGQAEGTIHATETISVFGWGNIQDLTATTSSPTSHIRLTSGADLSATGQAGNRLAAIALGTAKGTYQAGTHGQATSGSLLVSAVDSIPGISAQATNDAAVYSGGTLTGTVQAGHDALVSGKAAVIGTTTATNNHARVASIDGNVLGLVSAGHSASVFSKSGVVASVTAGSANPGGDATVSTAGSILGSVHAAHDVTAYAHDALLGGLSAGNDLVAYADQLTVGATAGHDATVAAKGSVIGTVNAGNHLRTTVAGPALGTFTAGQDASVVATGPILGAVTATDGNARVTTGAALIGAVDAGNNADVYSVGPTLGTIQAGHDAQATSWQSFIGSLDARHHASATVQKTLLGSVSADYNASALVIGSLLGTVSAGHDASVVVGDSLVGQVTAGHDAWARVKSSLVGSVSAARNADALSVGTLTGTVSGGRNASGTAWTELDGIVQAGTGNATAIAGTSLSGTVQAGTDADARSFGTLVGSVDAGQDAHLFSRSALIATVTAGRHLDALGLSQSIVQATSGLDSHINSRRSLIANVHAGRDAQLAGFENVNSQLTAGRHANAFAADNFFGSVTAGGNASAGAADMAMMWLTAGGDANAFAGSALSGTVTSLAGSASAFSAGHAGVIVDAAVDVTAFALDALFVFAYAGRDVEVMGTGGLYAALNAGRNIEAIGVGPTNVQAVAGNDIGVISTGHTFAALFAPGDVRVASYGDLTTYVTAGDDAAVWSRGNLFGVIDVGDELWGLKSYSDAFVMINARQVNFVQAWGPISGSIDATDQIVWVRSGDAITAALTAPIIGTVVEFDPTVFLDAWPEVPDVSTEHIRAQFRRLQRDLAAARNSLDAFSTGMVEVRNASHEAALRSFDFTIGDRRAAQGAVDAARHQVALAVEQAYAQDLQFLAQASSDLQAALDAAQAWAKQQHALDKFRLQLAREEGEAFEARIQMQMEIRNVLAELEASGKELMAQAEMIKFESGATLWNEEFKEQVQEIIWDRINTVLDVMQTLLDIVGLIPIFGDVVDVVNGLIYAARGRWLDASLSLVSALSFIGVGYAGNAAKWGYKGLDAVGDAWRVGRKLLPNGAAVRGVAKTTLQHADNVDEVCKLGRLLRKAHIPQKALDYVGIGCFVAGTDVLVEPEDTQVTAAMPHAWLLPTLCIGIGLAGYQTLRPRKKQRSLYDDVLDELAEDDAWDDDWFAPASTTADDFDRALATADDHLRFFPVRR